MLYHIPILISHISDTFLLNSNNLVGTIRDSFDLFTNLTFLDVSDNTFSGAIPSSLLDIPTLSNLYLHENAFSGTIPSNYGNSPSLRDLYLSSNKLTGTIPELSVGQMPVLNELLLDNNMLEGRMPNSICNLRSLGRLEDLWADCRGTPPEVECSVPDCCTACF